MIRRFALAAAISALLFSVLASAEQPVGGREASADTSRGKLSVLMVLARDGFRDEEYEVPRSILEENDVEVTVASSDTMPARGVLGLEAEVDILLEDANVKDYDCIVFVGGPGAKDYWNDEAAHLLAKAAFDSGKALGAICIAPVTLANAGVLKGKNATVFETRETIGAFRKEGVVYTGDDVTVSGRIVTGRDPEAAAGFARSILSVLRRRPEVEEGE